MQNAIPKVDAKTLHPASWPENPQLEWCPPGHGDLYPALLGSGWLKRLLPDVKYMFVSNADNLGASLDLSLLHYFAESGAPFLMEVAERTAADRKGGHLALRNGTLVLRESAQTPEDDLEKFQDVARHRFFNTNNLWIRLDALKRQLDRQGGFIPLPVIRNTKTIDPRDKASPAVFQLETAMGAAIECFENSGAIVVPRTRFAPVKTTPDLLGLRSDAYEVTEDWRLVLSRRRHGVPPALDLDSRHYRLVEQLDRLLAGGVPSLVECRKLSVRGPIVFQEGIVFKGTVELRNKRAVPHTLESGVYEDVTLEFE
jgi:UTP--glucose-1-phosphate uridylyltransferase